MIASRTPASLFLAVTLALAGCGKSHNNAEADGASPPPNPDATYKGRTAESWAKQARDNDVDTACAAVRALQSLGADGAPFLVQVLPGRTEPFHREAETMIVRALLREKTTPNYAAKLLPIAKKWLRSKDVDDRRNGIDLAVALRAQAPPLLDDLRQLAPLLDAKNGKADAEDAIRRIETNSFEIDAAALNPAAWIEEGAKQAQDKAKKGDSRVRDGLQPNPNSPYNKGRYTTKPKAPQ